MMRELERVTRQGQTVTNHTLFVGDCLNILKDKNYFPDESADLVVTSPPYGLGKKYGVYSDGFSLTEWTRLIKGFGEESFRILRGSGSLFLNVSPIPHPKTTEIIPLDSYAYFIMKSCGFSLRNKIIWHFNNMQNCVRRLSGRWEAVLWFVKDIKNYVFNLDSVKVPYLTSDKRITGTGRNPTDVWYFDRVNNMTKLKWGINHPCVYPEPMIERIIKMATNKFDLVLDPFVGSGTTMKVAKDLDRNSIGIDINPDYAQLVKKRLCEKDYNSNYSFEVIKYG